MSENILDFDDLFSNFSQTNRKVPEEDLGYINNYIHYYPRLVVVNTSYESYTKEVPVLIQPLAFIPLPVVKSSRYEYKEEDN